MNKFTQLMGALFLGGLGITAATVLPIGLLLYWLRTDFGAEYALAFFIAIVVVGALIVGFWLSSRNTARTLEIASDFAHDMASAQKAQAGVARDYARIELEAAKAQLRGHTIDAQQVHQLAAQRARMLTAQPADDNADDNADWYNQFRPTPPATIEQDDGNGFTVY